jgi:hypothetical protein
LVIGAPSPPSGQSALSGCESVTPITTAADFACFEDAMAVLLLAASTQP